MAEQDNTIKTTVLLNTAQAEQQIVKLNATASDSTKSLEERVAAKNKQVELQNQLSKQTIKALNDERRTLEGKGATEKELMAIKVKLDKANLAAVKVTENNTKAQNKLAAAYRDSSDPVKNLDKATGGLIGKMQMLAANPIVAVLGLLAGLFKLVHTAINSTEDGAASFNAVMAAVQQVFTNLITFISSIVQPLFEWLAGFLAKDLGGAFEAMGGYIDAIKLGFEAFINGVILGLTPLRSLIALAQAAALAVKGDFEGAKQVMIDFKQSVIDAAGAVGTNLVAALKKVKETNEDVTKAFNDATNAGDSLIARAAQLELRQNAFNKAKRAQELLDAKLGVQSRQALADSKDLSLSWDARYKRLQDFKRIENEIAQGKKRTLETEIGIQRDIMSLGGNKKEDEEKLNNLLIEREHINERLAKQQGKFNSLSKEFENQRKKEILDQKNAEIELEEIKIQRLRNARTVTLEEEKAFLQKKMELELSNDELTATQKQIIGEKHKDDLAALDLIEQEKKDAVFAAELDATLSKNEAELELKREQGEKVLEMEQAFNELRRQQELDNAELTEAERVAINAKYDAINLKMERDYLKATKKSVDEAAQQGAEAAAEAFGISQELKIAQLVMAAPEAVGNSFTKAAEVYAPPVSLAMGALGAAGVIVPIIKGLNDIRKTRFPGSKKRGGGGSVSMPSAGGGGGGSVSSDAITNIAANNSARLGVDPSLGLNAGTSAANNVLGSSSPNIIFSENKYQDFQNQVTFKEGKTSI